MRARSGSKEILIHCWWKCRMVQPLYLFVCLFCCVFSIYLFYFYFWLHWVLVAARRIFTEACRIFRCSTRVLRCGPQASLQLRRAGFLSLVVAQGLQGTWALQLWRAGSRGCGLYSLQPLVEVQELSSCGTRAQLSCGMWDLSSLPRDRTRVPCIVRRLLYHWTTREVPTQPYQKMIWQLLTKLNILLPYNPAIMFLVIYPKYTMNF